MLKPRPLLECGRHHGERGAGVNDHPIPSSRRRGRESILPIICLIPHGVHSRLQLGAGLPGLIGYISLPDAGVNVIDIISLSCGQFPILPQEHHSGH